MNRSPSSRQLKNIKFFLPVGKTCWQFLCGLQVDFMFSVGVKIPKISLQTFIIVEINIILGI